MFSFKKADKGNNPAIKELPAAAGTYTVGEVAVVSSGLITKVSGSDTPTHVTCGAGTLASGDIIAVNPIYADMEFETTLSASGSSLKAGDKVTIASDSARVTATTANGVATIVEIISSASGGGIVVKFD